MDFDKLKYAISSSFYKDGKKEISCNIFWNSENLPFRWGFNNPIEEFLRRDKDEGD